MSEGWGVIYKLTNTVNEKEYVGRTIDLNRRIRQHKVYNKQVIDRAIDEYGWAKFTVEILADNIPESELVEKEIKYIERCETFRDGYNMTEGGGSYEMTEETKQKMSENHADVSGKNNPMYEKERPRETREKISENQPDRNGKNNPMYGKERSKETKRKMSENHADFSGANHPKAKITKEGGKEIKAKYEEGEDVPRKGLAKEYDTSLSTVDRIVRGEHWTVKEEAK